MNNLIITDKEIAIELVKEDGDALRYVSKELRNDKEVVLEAVKQNEHALYYASEEMKKDKEIIREALKNNFDVLQYIEGLDKNEDVMIEAIKQGYDFDLLDKELKSDVEFLLKIGKYNEEAYKYLTEYYEGTRGYIISDKELMLRRLNEDGYDALQYASEELRGDKEVVLKAVKEYGYNLEYASDELANDPEVVLEAISTDADVLEYASEDLKNNKEFILIAIDKVIEKGVNEFYKIIKYTEEEIKYDADMMLRIFKLADNFYPFDEVCRECGLDEKTVMNQEPEVVLEVVKLFPESLDYIDEKIPNYKEIILEALDVHDTEAILGYINEELRNDKDFMLKAIEKKDDALHYVSEELEYDEDFLLKALEKNENASFEYINEEAEATIKNEFLIEKIKEHRYKGTMIQLENELKKEESISAKLDEIQNQIDNKEQEVK